jgi:hypothetical protein
MKTRVRTGIGAIAVVATIVTVALALTMASAASDRKVPIPNPWAGLTDSQKNDVVAATHARNVQYLQSFEARHGNPRSLPVIKIDTYQAPPQSFGAAATQATAVVHGAVRSVHFSADPNGNLPQMTASVDVIGVGRGTVARSTITVRQLGGPVAQPNGGGALVRLGGEELVLPGDEVVLMLASVQPGGDAYRMVYGAGVYFVRNGLLSGEAASRYGLAGGSLTVRWATMTSRELPLTAYPLQSNPKAES